MIALLCFVLAVLASALKSMSRLEAKNALRLRICAALSCKRCGLVARKRSQTEMS